MSNAYRYVELLGMKTTSLPALLREVEKGLPYRAYERFATVLGATADDLLRLVGIPRRTLVRRKAEGRFSSDESDRLLRAARVFGRALDLFDGDRDAALEWLSEPQIALGGSVPLDVARTEVGAHEVELLALRIEHGVYS
jgi:putative toxin-antitoxin system antitoxin component (TIGR02293 family)